MKTLGRCFLLVSALGFALFVARSALAEPAGDLETARHWFQQATELEKASEWRKASEKLDQALAIKETPGLHFHRAHCAEQMGELVLAARHYARSDELIRAGASAPDVEELLVPARARVLARVPRLAVRLPSDVPTATLEIDGARVTEFLETPIMLDPGRHRIVARAPGHADFEMEITLVEAETRTLAIALPPLEQSEAARPPPPQPKTETDTSGWGAREVVLVGEAAVTLVGLGAGIGFSIAKGSATERIDQAQRDIDAAAPNDSTACGGESPAAACADLDEALRDRDRAVRFATIGFVTAGVGAAATLTTWFLWPSERVAATAGVSLTPGGATLSLRGRF